VEVVTRTAKRSGKAAEELVHDTSRCLQRHTALTVATTFAIGVATGTLIGWMMKRQKQPGDQRAS
jgi:ABC-type nitrate/sulfonate/bicarbonate transport system permease component